MSPQLIALIQAAIEMKRLSQESEQFGQSQELEKRKLTMNEHDANLNSAGKLLALLKTIRTSEGRQAFIDTASTNANIPSGIMSTIAGGVPVGTSTTLDDIVARGAGGIDPVQAASVNLTGHMQGENTGDMLHKKFIDTQAGGNNDLWQEFMNVSQTGHTVGQNAFDMTEANMPKPSLMQAVEIAHGLRIPIAKIAELALQSRGVSAEEQNANSATFNAVTGRQQQEATERQQKSEDELRAMGLYDGGGRGNEMQSRISAYGHALDALGQLTKGGSLPFATQEILKGIASDMLRAGGGDQKFYNYLMPHAASPSWLDTYLTRR